MDQELISYLDRRFGELRAEMGTVRDGLRAEIGAVREDLRTEFRTEIRQLGVTVEGLRTQIQIVAEGVVTVDEKLEQFRHEVSAEHDEIKAMIKFSYTELDRRIIQLEASTRNLEARVARLETART